MKISIVALSLFVLGRCNSESTPAEDISMLTTSNDESSSEAGNTSSPVANIVGDHLRVLDGTNIFDVIDAFNNLKDTNKQDVSSSSLLEAQDIDSDGEEYGNVLSRRGLVVSSKRKRRTKADESADKDEDKVEEGALSYDSADYPERKIGFLYSKNIIYPGYEKSTKDYYKYKIFRWRYGLRYYMKDPSGKTIVTMRRSESTDTKLKLYWKMKHLDPRCKDGPNGDDNSCGVSIHENSGMYAACKFEKTIGDQKFVGSESPWDSSFYVTDKYGESKGTSNVNSGLNLFENMGCVVVYYNLGGEPISCGVLRAYYEDAI